MASAWDATPVAPGQTAPAGSAWDRTPHTPLERAQIDDPGILQSGLIGAGRTFDRIGRGMQQVYYGLTGNHTAQAALQQSAADDDEQYAKLKALHPFATGVGESVPSMVIPAGGAATLGGNVARMAIAGALPSALEYGSASDRATNAGWNALAGASMPLAGAAAKTAWAAAEPFRSAGQQAIVGRLLNRVSGDDAASVASRLASAAPLVPGSFPTAAQVAQNGGVAALERSSAAVNPAPFTQRGLEQTLARKNAIESVSNTPEALSDALAMRRQISDGNYAYANRVGPDPSVFTPEAQANISAMQARMPEKALRDAQTIATIKGQPMDNSNVVNGLHWAKTSLSGMADAEQNPAMADALKDLAGQYNAGLEQISPLYGAANSLYADMSRPINQMQIGQALRAKVLPSLVDHGQLIGEKAQQYGAALADEGLPARATGFPGATWENTMEPAQMDALNGVAGDLARGVNAAKLGAGPNSTTAQNIAMQNIANQSGMPSAMGLVTKAGGKALDWLYHGAESDLQSQLADALLNPTSGAALMQQAAPSFMAGSPLARQLLSQGAQRSGFLLGPTGSAVQNALAPVSPGQ